MKIGIVSDHRGYELKKKLLKDYNFIDYGTNSKEIVDYPDYAFKLGKAINKKEVDLGIAICGSGIGMSIALNKVKNIRCARVHSIKDVIITRQDNDATVISFSSVLLYDKVKRMIETFIQTPFKEEERYKRRNNQIKEYEQK